ncbi:hypothetical protein FA743_19935 [Paracoccus gahaiensis]|uniref:Uncharacterized protein n=1 Tax=Paracoccus gahaiensis TaxID=1706839 RepID=A0A4U0RKT5_9RHOB|nr:hypothetical protein [Paracoccus gahaiensis]TJZ88624.1 hypothetical protein FA743_19935 [Paracoccus gahaiensis]
MLRLIFSIMSTLMVLQVATPVARAQDVQEIAPEAPGVQEFFREAADISGSVVLGVQVQFQAADGPRLIGYLPAEWGGEMACIHVVSVDGRYEAYGNYPVPASWQGGAAALTFVTGYSALLRGVPADGIGVMVARGPCGQGKADELSVVLWNTRDAPAVDIIVNSFNADEVFAYVDEQTAPVRCERLELESTIAFDRKCRIDPADRAGPTDITIYRLKDGKPSEPTSVVVWFPDT